MDYIFEVSGNSEMEYHAILYSIWSAKIVRVKTRPNTIGPKIVPGYQFQQEYELSNQLQV